MSNKLIALRLNGVLQSWGLDSDYTYRNSSLFPTKSAVLGLCCAAKGIKRGSQEEFEFLKKIADKPMTAISLPRSRSVKQKKWNIHVRRISDFHTVENTKIASGKINSDAVLTHRQYLCDADFLVILEMVSNLADELKVVLSDPTWGVWLGRKSCIPSMPVFAGIFQNFEEISNNLLGGKSLDFFTHQKDIETWQEGSDTLMDTPVDFQINKREYGLRRVKTYEAENKINGE